MDPRLDKLFAAVRAACSPLTWSRGVELQRAGAALFDHADDDATLFRIAARRGGVGRSVTLYPGDADWECPCGSSEGACEHVAAAVITWRRAEETGEKLAEVAAPAARVGYRFLRAAGGLELARAVVSERGETPLESTLAGIAGRLGAGRFVASQADLAAELALGTHRRGVLPRPLVVRVLAALARCEEILLDGRAVRVSPEPVVPLAVVEDQDDGFRLRIEDDPAVEESFANGIVRCGELLRPVGEAKLTGRELHELPRGVRYGPDRVAELVTDVLPSLRRRIHVEVRTSRLPSTSSEPPRIEIDTSREGERLSVLATLVYGSPSRARVDGGRLVHLRGPVPLRDEAAERRLLSRLDRELGLAPGVRAELEGEAAVAFARRLQRWEGAPRTEDLAHFRLSPPLVPRVTLGRDAFDVVFESVEGAPGRPARSHGRADPRAVLRAHGAGGSLVPLLEGGYAPLPGDWLERFGPIVADLIAARESASGIPGAILPDLARLCQALDHPPPPGYERLRSVVESFEGLPRAILPPDLRAELRSYQARGVDWLVFLRDTGLGALLADDMGLGKTLQTLCAVRGRTLVVAPASVVHNWLAEARRFRPALRVAVYHGAGRTLDERADLTLTTYALLRLDVEPLAAAAWDTVVLDEAQAIKNPESQVAAAAFRLRAGFRIALTGTPVENRLEELWSQLHFANPGLLGGRADFERRYAGPIASGDAEVARRLRERIRPFVLRRLKRDVAPELPPRTEVVLRCELDPQERAVYDAVRAATLAEVVSRLEAGGGVMAALEALLRLRQAACHAGLLPGRSDARSSKIDLLVETLEEVVAEGHKALVFSQWTSLLDRVEPAIREAGIGFTRLDGSTRDREAVVGAFQDAAGPPVLLVSLKAGGTGLNLTAADHVFLLDPWWNPAVEDQAADRTHRIGQTRPVMVYRLIAEQTVEERILDLQARKRELADVALGEAQAAAALSRDDLLELLR